MAFRSISRLTSIPSLMPISSASIQKIATSFTKQQCEAMKDMFGARVRSHHALDFRPSLAPGQKSLLSCPSSRSLDRRAFVRKKSPNAALLLVALALATLILLPVLAVA